MNLQPLGDRLIVEVLDEEETTISGIVLPDTAKEKPQRGRVLSVGPGARVRLQRTLPSRGLPASCSGQDAALARHR